MKINAIDTTMTEAEISAVKTKITDAKLMMPFLLALTAKERQASFKLSTKRFDFVTKVIAVCQNEPAVIPTWVNLDELKKDYALSNQLLGIENILESLLIEVRDTRMQMGIEALKSATDVYGLVQKSKDRIPGVEAIYDALRASYPGRGKTKKKTE